MRPPRRIDQLAPRGLHSPNQRHHPDPAAPRTQIRPLPNDKIDTSSARKAEPDRGDTGMPLSVDNHADAVAGEIALQAKQQHAGSHPVTGGSAL